MVEVSDSEMAPPPTEVDAERERKKALLVYKSNQHSSDEEEEEDEEDEQNDEDARSVRGGHDTVSVEDEAEEEEDARSVRSEGGSIEEEDDDDNDEDEEDDDAEEEDDVQVEKDDDESVNAPSDDDLESSAPPTPRHDTDDDDDLKSEKDDDTEDSATESKHTDTLTTAAERGGDAARASATAAATNSKLNVEEIIAARRRTGVKKECDVCHEGRNGRRAMLCANCKTMFHSSCYRKKYNKLISATNKQWFCPDCEPARKAAASPEKHDHATPRKKKSSGGSAAAAAMAMAEERSSKAIARESTKSRKSGGASKSGRERDVPSSVSGMTGSTGEGIPLVIGSSVLDQELTRVTDIAMRSGRKINGWIIERTTEMLELTKALAVEVQETIDTDVHGTVVDHHHFAPATASRSISILHHDAASSGTGPLPPLSALAMISSSSTSTSTSTSSSDPAHHHHALNGQTNHANHTSHMNAKNTRLHSLQDGLHSLKNMLEQLQVVGIQFEVDLIRDIKMPPVKEEPKPVAPTTTRKSGGTTSAARSASGNAAAKQAKPGASRLYSAKQIQKLEEWYQKSSRPESSEIQSMYRIINSPEYADKELQPEGISVKQIRIWFDNRRAKERLDYMRIKMKDISTSDMDAEDVKRMKAAYIDEAKEVLEARVSRLKENGKMVPLIDEADTLLLQSAERSLPMSKTTKASPAAKGGAFSAHPFGGDKSLVNMKKRIRIDYVASVRKAMKDARDAGKSEDEMKLIKTAAIERARERLHVPYKNARMGPTKPLGKDEVSHVKMTMLKLLEEDAPAEELTDVVELLLSVVIPRDVLIESQLHRQLNLVLKAHKDNKELVKQTTKLLDEFTTIVENSDEVEYDDDAGAASFHDERGIKKKGGKKDSTNLLLSVDSEALPGTPGASPDSPGASPDHRKSRVKFSRDQLMKLERHFYKEDTPSKKNLEKLSKKLNDIAARDRSCDGQGGIDYKQIRSWFYKRRSTNQPPQALSSADLRELKLLGPPSSSSSSASDTQSDSDEAAAAVVAAKPIKTSSGGKNKASAATGGTKRKASEEKAATPASSSKRQKKSDASTGSASKKEAASASAAAAIAAGGGGGGGGKQHAGRIFNVKQLATIIEEYEKNPRPTVARLEELQKILNQDDHGDDHFPNPLGVTKRQIKTWFSNRRAKERLEVIRMKVHTGDKTKDGRGVAKHEEEDDSANSNSNSDSDSDSISNSEEDLEDEEVDAEENRPIKKVKASSSSSSAPSAAKKELFTSERNGGDHGDSDVDEVDDDDEDVDMGSDDDDDEGDQVDKDSDDDVDKDSDNDNDEVDEDDD